MASYEKQGCIPHPYIFVQLLQDSEALRVSESKQYALRVVRNCVDAHLELRRTCGRYIAAPIIGSEPIVYTIRRCGNPNEDSVQQKLETLAPQYVAKGFLS